MSQRAMKTYCIVAVLVAITQVTTFCIAQPPSDSDGDTAAENSTVSELFPARDADKSGSLTEEELGTGGGRDEATLKRDFKVFDANADGLLSEVEFLNIPAFTPEEKRSAIPDPVVLLSATKYSELESRWSELDSDSDGSLNQDEFNTTKIAQYVRGLEKSGFNDWDLDKDSKVSKGEVAEILNIAFGVRSPTGELLRCKTGQVVDWRLFREMNPDENGKVLRQEYIRVLGSVEEAEKWFPGINSGADEKFTVTEFSKSRHRTDPVNTFLGLDSDLDGRLSPKEMDGVPAGWGPPGKNWLAGFDDDGDGTYSLREFQLIPQVNLLADWQSAQDTNQDGKLSLEEFRLMPAPALAALSAEYFAKLDLDKDETLSLKEWAFNTSQPDAKFLLLDVDTDGELTEPEFVSETTLPVQRLRRDFKVFDADGNSRLTHDEFLSIPHWVPESQRTTIPDPVVLLSEAGFSELTRDWADWDKNSDGVLDAEEFQTSPIRQKVSGMDQSGFDEWDWDHDKQVSREDTARVLDLAFGVRSPTGELLRSKAGVIVDWRSFLGFKLDSNGKALRADYIQSKGSLEKARESFPGIDETSQTTFSVTDFAKTTHRIDSVQMFLHLDADLNGLLSPEEMQALPAWGPPGKNWLKGFDDNGDSSYSLFEFRLIPQINLLTTWHAAHDADGDGKLSLQEFRFMPFPALAALSAEYFHRLDVNQDDTLSLSEWPFQTSNPGAKFTTLDVDADGELTEAEFITEGNLPLDRLKRDFKVFDADSNGQMTETEFLSIPHWVPANHRTVIPDPAARLSETSLSELTKSWTDWDKDSDGSLDSGEFQTAAITRKISGLEMTGFADWDQDHDKKVSKEDVARIIDIAFGICAPTGEFLRSKTGQVVDWRGFLALNPDENGKVSREAYIKMIGTSSKPETWFPTIHTASNEKFGVTEFLTSNHKTDPISHFLSLDADLNGLLSPAELDALPAGWGPPGKNWLPGFDDDHDGAYSLLEFRFIPHVNLLATWQGARDTDNDGKLSPHEFHFMPTPALAALSKEYFRRLDIDSDGFLTLKEWPFSFDFARVPRDVIIEHRDQNGDHVLNFEEVLGEIRRPEPGDKIDLNQEAALARMEEAFSRADVNADGQLDRQELSSDDGLEAIAPGSSGVAKKVNFNSIAPVSKFMGLEDASLETYLIIEVNVLLVVGVAIYLYRKRVRKK